MRVGGVGVGSGVVVRACVCVGGRGCACVCVWSCVRACVPPHEFPANYPEPRRPGGKKPPPFPPDLARPDPDKPP